MNEQWMKEILQDVLAAVNYAYEQAASSDVSIVFEHELRSDDEAKEQLNRLRDAKEFIKLYV